MARFNKGFLRAFSGAVGSIEGYELNGQLIIRSRRSKSSTPPSAKQIECRERMKLISTALGSITDVLRIGFSETESAKQQNAYNTAVAHNLKHAVTGSYPDLSIDYAKLRVTQGSLSINGLTPSILLEREKLIITWTNQTTDLQYDQRAILVAIAPALRQAVYNLCGNLRESETDFLRLPAEWQGHEIHSYLSFRNETGEICSNSIYCGKIG